MRQFRKACSHDWGHIVRFVFQREEIFDCNSVFRLHLDLNSVVVSIFVTNYVKFRRVVVRRVVQVLHKPVGKNQRARRGVGVGERSRRPVKNLRAQSNTNFVRQINLPMFSHFKPTVSQLTLLSATKTHGSTPVTELLV